MTKRVSIGVVAASLILSAASALALTSGTDVVVPAGARGPGVVGFWVTDVYVFNPGSLSATVTVDWLLREADNTNPQATVTFTVAPGETLVLDDVFLETFGASSGGGAFRVRSTQAVAVNSRIYNQQGDVTFGQGFEGVPLSAAVAAGRSTDVMGLAETTSFRSNVVLFDASGSGSTVTLSLLDETGSAIGSERAYTLRPYDARLFRVTALPGVTSFDYGRLHAEVTSGAVIVVAAKADNDASTGDPTTLEAWMPASVAESEDGTYQFAIYDSLWFAAGGNLVIEGGEVTAVTGTYFNWDKTEGSEPECTLLFAWGGALSPSIPVADFASGVDFVTPYPDGGQMTYTLRFALDNNASLAGAIAAVGSSFTGLDSGCNGAFPDLDLEGGKTQ